MKDSESTLVKDLLATLREEIQDRQKGLVFKHADHGTSGIPDISVTLNGKTSWWEVKYVNPDLIGTDLQHLTARRLDRAGVCRYIVFIETETGPETHVLPPALLDRFLETGRSEVHCKGFSMAMILSVVLTVHRPL